MSRTRWIEPQVYSATAIWQLIRLAVCSAERLRLVTATVVCALLLPITLSQVHAQDQNPSSGPPTVIADRITFRNGDRRFLAEGNVVVTIDGQVLTCPRLESDGETLTVEGPIRWADDSGNVLTSDLAEVSVDFQRGMLSGVRLLIDRHVQISANRLTFSQQEFDVIRDVRVTPCQICESGEPPVWHFRSRLLVRDKEEQRLYLRGVQLRVGPVPVFYLPWLSIPLARSANPNGLLFPELSYDSDAGAGIRIPYYLRLGPHADATLTPGLSADGQSSFGYDYRQAFDRGWLTMSGEVAINDPQELFAEEKKLFRGGLKLGDDGKLLALHTDNAEHAGDGLAQIFPEEHELTVVTAGRRTDHQYAVGRYIGLEADRQKTNDEDPMSSLSDLQWHGHRTWSRAGLVQLSMGVRSFQHVEHDDVLHANLRLDYSHSRILDPGLIAEFAAAVNATATEWTEEKAKHKHADIRPQVSASIALPLVRTGKQTREVLEPGLHLHYSKADESRPAPELQQPVVSIDSSSLASADRLAGLGQDEQGLRLSAGLGYTLFDGDGNEFELAAGRIFRMGMEDDRFQEPANGRPNSYYAAFAGIRSKGGLSFGQHVSLDEDLEPLIEESALQYIGDGFGVKLAHGWISENFDGNKAKSWSLDASYRVQDHWVLNGGWQHDVYAQGKRTVDVGLTYSHQCLRAGLKVERELSTATTPQPSTSIGFTTTIEGLNKAIGGPSETCL